VIAESVNVDLCYLIGTGCCSGMFFYKQMKFPNQARLCQYAKQYIILRLKLCLVYTYSLQIIKVYGQNSKTNAVIYKERLTNTRYFQIKLDFVIPAAF